MKSTLILAVVIVLAPAQATVAIDNSAAPRTTIRARAPVDLKKFGVQPIGNWQVDPAETQYLDTLFSEAMAAKQTVAPGPEATAQQRAVDNLLRSELESFVGTNASSSYAPSLHLFLGHQARMRCGYSLAIEHYQAAFDKVLGSPDHTAQQIAHEASGALAKLLALTGRIAEMDALEAVASQNGPLVVGGCDWAWAKEMHGCANDHFVREM